MTDTHTRVLGDATEPLGGKVEGLMRLVEHGFEVPPWFVIAPTMASSIKIVPTEFLETLGDGPYAVRSSATGEDGAQSSFAGQFLTRLDVHTENLVEAIREVAASAGSDHAEFYAERVATKKTASVAVVVQRMIPADFAGVAFSHDPVDGTDTVVISAVRGLGESLVSGEQNGETYRVPSNGKTVYPETPKPMLLDVFVDTIAREVELAAAAFGGPQDMEWAIRDNHLYFLQARPITTIRNAALDIIWDNANIAESYGGLVSPLTFSFASYGYAAAYRQMLAALKIPKSKIERERYALENMLGLVEGRMYYHIANWYRLLALLPGFRINRTFMERMMGMDEGLGSESLREIESTNTTSPTRDAFDALRTTLALIKEQLGLKKSVAKFHAWFRETMAESTNPSGLHVAALREQYDLIDSRLSTRWTTPLVNDFLTMIWFGVLGSMCEKWCGDTDRTLQNDLLTHGDSMVSAEPARLIEAMAELIRRRNNKRDTDEDNVIERDLEKLKKAYVEKFGDRCESELKLESIPLDIDQSPLDLAVERTAKNPIRPTSERSNNGLATAEGRVAKAIRTPIKRAAFGLALRNARTCILNREEMRLERTRLFGRIRKIFVALGIELHRRSIIEDPRDIFWLSVDEAFDEAREPSTTRETISERKIRYARYAGKPAPPNRLTTNAEKIVSVGGKQASKSFDICDANVRRGTGCCAGIVRGIAQIVRDPSEDFESNRILVTERTDPSWVMLFPATNGILVERGSLLSHAAIVSRELDIPSVVGIDGLTTWLRTGDLVEFDGSTGIVRRILPPPSDGYENTP